MELDDLRVVESPVEKRSSLYIGEANVRDVGSAFISRRFDRFRDAPFWQSRGSASLHLYRGGWRCLEATTNVQSAHTNMTTIMLSSQPLSWRAAVYLSAKTGQYSVVVRFTFASSASHHSLIDSLTPYNKKYKHHDILFISTCFRLNDGIQHPSRPGRPAISHCSRCRRLQCWPIRNSAKSDVSLIRLDCTPIHGHQMGQELYQHRLAYLSITSCFWAGPSANDTLSGGPKPRIRRSILERGR